MTNITLEHQAEHNKLLNAAIHLLKKPFFSITTIFSIGQNDQVDVNDGKVASINNGLITIIQTPEDPALLYLGKFEIILENPKVNPIKNNEKIYSLIDDKEKIGLIDFTKFQNSKYDKDKLQSLAGILLEHIKANKALVLKSYNQQELNPQTVNETAFEDAVISFIDQIEQRILPKLK